MEPEALEECDNTCNGSELEPESMALILPDRGTTDKMAEMFKALGDPTRVRLIYALSQRAVCARFVGYPRHGAIGRIPSAPLFAQSADRKAPQGRQDGLLFTKRCACGTDFSADA